MLSSPMHSPCVHSCVTHEPPGGSLVPSLWIYSSRTPQAFPLHSPYVRSLLSLVFNAAVTWVVTQRSSPAGGGGALRDDPNNGYVGFSPST